MAWVSSLRNSDKLESAPFTDANQLGFFYLFFHIQKEEKLCLKTSSNFLINQMALEMKFIQDHLSITKISSQFKDLHFSRAIQRSSLHHFNLISLQKFPVGGAADAQFKICPNYLEWGKALNLLWLNHLQMFKGESLQNFELNSLDLIDLLIKFQMSLMARKEEKN